MTQHTLTDNAYDGDDITVMRIYKDYVLFSVEDNGREFGSFSLTKQEFERAIYIYTERSSHDKQRS